MINWFKSKSEETQSSIVIQKSKPKDVIFHVEVFAIVGMSEYFHERYSVNKWNDYKTLEDGSSNIIHDYAASSQRKFVKAGNNLIPWHKIDKLEFKIKREVIERENNV